MNTEIFKAGQPVTYLGQPATVIHGNEPCPEWGQNEAGDTINIRFDKPVAVRLLVLPR